MGSTNKTAHYELPQFVANDKPSWLGDVNEAMEAIDTGIYGAKSSADGAQQTANNAVAGVQSAGTRMDGIQTQLDTVATQANQTATAVNQHTASIATNSANINTLNSRMGSTDISAIGDGTVTGAISSIAQGGGGGTSNVRWNPVTDFIEVLKNGSWIQTTLKALVNAIAVWANGIFGIAVYNGDYKVSGNFTAQAYVKDGTVLKSSGLTTGKASTLVTELLDLTTKNRIKVTTATGVHELNIASYTGNAYLCFYHSSQQANQFLLSTQQENFLAGQISSYIKDMGSTSEVSITEIVIE